MFEYRFTVAAQLSHREPLSYSVAPRTVPTFVSQFTNPRPHEQTGQSQTSGVSWPYRWSSSRTRLCALEGT